MNIGIILAGGIGSRTGWSIPKQFIDILGKPMILYTIEAFQESEKIDSILLVCNIEYIGYLKKIIEDYDCHEKILGIIAGGKTHQDSLTNALIELKKEQVLSKDIVVIHNANRPLVTVELIDDSINVCEQCGCGVSAITCVDTMMYSQDKISSDVFIDREKTMRAQSPQAYYLNEIYEVYLQAKRDELENKYECDLMTYYGKKIYFSKGNENNLKLTFAEDEVVIEALLTQRKELEEIKRKEELQIMCKEIMDVVYDICKKHNLTCFLAYGTLLGAIRHKGFIPWDDDIDLMMPIADYRKLEKILKAELPENYFLQTFETDRFYGLNWMKIRKNGTTCVDKRWAPISCHSGVDVDIFQISYVPDNKIYRFFWLFLYRLQWSLLESFILEGNPKELIKKKKKLYYKFLMKIPYILRFKVAKSLDEIVFGNDINTDNVILGTRNVYYPAEWFKESVQVEFEGDYYPAPKEFDKYLEKRYGEYMKLPDKKNQHGKNFVEVNLKKQRSNPIKPKTVFRSNG